MCSHGTAKGPVEATPPTAYWTRGVRSATVRSVMPDSSHGRGGVAPHREEPMSREELRSRIAHKLMGAYVLPNDDEVIKREEARAHELAEQILIIVGVINQPAEI